MKGSVFILLLLTAGAAGIVSGECACRLPVVAICSAFFAGAGICWLWRGAKEFMRQILERAVAESRYAAGIDDKGRQGESRDDQAVLDLLVTNAMARSLAPQEKVSHPEIERGAALIRCQFGEEKTWKAALQASGLSN